MYVYFVDARERLKKKIKKSAFSKRCAELIVRIKLHFVCSGVLFYRERIAL